VASTSTAFMAAPMPAAHRAIRHRRWRPAARP
jgi:hypothetical protein